MQINSLNNSKNYKQNFGINMSKYVERKIQKYIDRGIINDNGYLFETIEKLPGKFVLTEFTAHLGSAFDFFAYLFGRTKYPRIRTEIYHPSKFPYLRQFKHFHATDIMVRNRDVRKPLTTKEIIFAIKSHIANMADEAMAKKAKKGELKSKLPDLKQAFPTVRVDIASQKYAKTDDCNAYHALKRIKLLEAYWDHKHLGI